MNISDMIEEFIKDTIGKDSKLDISRNELANYFNVAPSQINYVLSTRFTYERGFVTESKRGGSGYVTILRTEDKNPIWLKNILSRLNEDIDYKSGCFIIDELENRKVLNSSQAELLKIAISNNALSNPFRLENKTRAQILKRVIFSLQRKKND